MKYLFISLILIIKVQIAFCQNLVVNPGFEEFKRKPHLGINYMLRDSTFQYGKGQIDYAVCYKLKLKLQKSKSKKKCKCYYNVEPNSGDAMALISPDYFTYSKKYFKFPRKLQLDMKDTLKANQTYSIKFYFYFSPLSWYPANDLGIYFYKNKTMILPSDENYFIDVTPTISINSDSLSIRGQWLSYSINYKAKGGEKYLLFGSFKERRFESQEEKPLSNKLMKAGPHKGEIYKDENVTNYFIDDFTIEPIIR